MQHKLVISLSHVDSSDLEPKEERAGFGVVKLETEDVLLTGGIDQHTNQQREGPLVSGYHLAEWLAWNWWRLRWEWWHHENACNDVVDEWDFAHRLSTIGEGYEWPNIAIASDGFMTGITSYPSIDHASFRYFGAPMTLIPASILEAAVEDFVSKVMDELNARGLCETNLHRLWSELQTERQDPETASLRRLEARLGYDPNEASHLGDGWRNDAAQLGGDSLEELAADAAYQGKPTEMMSASQITEMADSCGFEVSGQDSIAPRERSSEWGNVEAWRIGEKYAHELRMEARIDVGDPVSNERLAEIAGVSKNAISASDCIGDISFFLERVDRKSDARVVFRSKWETGRRFALARIVGDRLFAWEDNMFPATRSYTCRQQAQRAFAAEFLSPFEAVSDMLGADDSEDRQNEIAEHYQVSPIAVKTILANKGRISRDDISGIVHRPHFADQFETTSIEFS